MKLLTNKILARIVFGLALTSQSAIAFENQASKSGGFLTGINLRNCVAGKEKKCVQLKSAHVITSQIASIFKFNSSELTIKTGQNEEVIQVLSGYFDFSQDLLLVQSTSKEEVLIDLKNLKIRRFKL